MRTLLFSSALLVLIEILPAFAETPPPDTSPFVRFAPGIGSQLYGSGSPEATANVLNCDLLVNQLWPYPDSLVTAICQDATTACIRYRLIVGNEKTAKDGRINTLKRNLPIAYKDTEMKILGCVAAIELTISGGELLSNTSGKTTVGGY